MLRKPFNLIQRWSNGVLIWTSGPWTLIDPRPTFGEYREFDGWWRETRPSRAALKPCDEPAEGSP